MWTLPLTGLPHMSSEDDVYGGFFIPKGVFRVVIVLSLDHLLNHLAQKDP